MRFSHAHERRGGPTRPPGDLPDDDPGERLPAVAERADTPIGRLWRASGLVQLPGRRGGRDCRQPDGFVDRLLARAPRGARQAPRTSWRGRFPLRATLWAPRLE